MEHINIRFIHIWWVNVCRPLHTTGGISNQHSHSVDNYLHGLWLCLCRYNNRLCFPPPYFSRYNKENWWGNGPTDFLLFVSLSLFKVSPMWVLISLAPSTESETRPTASTKVHHLTLFGSLKRCWTNSADMLINLWSVQRTVAPPSVMLNFNLTVRFLKLGERSGLCRRRNESKLLNSVVDEPRLAEFQWNTSAAQSLRGTGDLTLQSNDD